MGPEPEINKLNNHQFLTDQWPLQYGCENEKPLIAEIFRKERGMSHSNRYNTDSDGYNRQKNFGQFFSCFEFFLSPCTE